jgi:subtilisin family serine protease
MSKRRFMLFGALALLMLLLPAGAASAASGQTPAHVPGNVIVKYESGVTAAAVRTDARQEGTEVVRQIVGPVARGGRLAVIHSDTQTTAELIAAFAADPRVMYAEPDYIYEIDVTPNDPALSGLWGMPKISAPAAWDVSTGSPAVVIASIDTGVDYTHPDLAANMWHNPGEIPANGIDDDANGYTDDVYGIDAYNNDSDPTDDHGHGTHTSGTMAAVGNNGVGIAGVCWQAQVMALKSFSSGGSGNSSTELPAIDYVINQKLLHGVNVVVINASWGGYGFSTAIHDAVAAAGNAGIVWVGSAGNDTNDNDTGPSYPASYDCSNIISVQATDSDDTMAYFSNYGATSVDIGAPGVEILSTLPGDYYESWNGTSMAAPHVAGAVASMAAKYPTETVGTRIAYILAGADRIPSLAGTTATGARLNVYRSLDHIGPTVTATGSPALGAWSKTPVTVALLAGDDITGVVSIEYQVAGGAWTPYTAPLVISAQGSTVIGSRATDLLGNIGVTATAEVLVDGVGPTTAARKSLTVRKGKKVTFSVRATDVSPTALVTVKVFKGKRIKKTLKAGMLATNSWQKTVWKRCSLAPGKYTWKVYAVDAAGNAQAKTGSKKLIVR